MRPANCWVMPRRAATLISAVTPDESRMRLRSVKSLSSYLLRRWRRERSAEASDAASARRAYARSPSYFLWAIIVDRIRRAGFKRVLELGCGQGQLAEFLLDQGVKQYVGVDASDGALERARRQAPGGIFVTADIRETAAHLTYEHDVIICTEVLERIATDLHVVSRFALEKHCVCSVSSVGSGMSQVRNFRSASDVETRYARFFRSFDVTTLEHPQSAGAQLFLFEGIRNEHVE